MQAQILPSRAALVDRIALQFEYGQNLIVLLGTSGLGKSYKFWLFWGTVYSLDIPLDLMTILTLIDKYLTHHP